MFHLLTFFFHYFLLTIAGTFGMRECVCLYILAFLYHGPLVFVARASFAAFNAKYVEP